jgi:hypothetical protein
MTSITDQGRTGALCRSCGGQHFRRSRLKAKDLWGLLVLRYPVRCMACSIRQTVPVSEARRAVSSRVKQVRASRDAAAGGVPAMDGETSRRRPSTVGAQATWAMPVRESVTMPDLHGVTLKHATSLPISDENLKS